MITFEALRDCNPVTCDEEKFDGHGEQDMIDRTWNLWKSIPAGTPQRNFVDSHKTLVANWIDDARSVAEVNHMCGKADERRRGQVDVGRITLQVIGWLEAVAAMGAVAVNLYPRLPQLINKRPTAPFVVAVSAGQTVQQWCQARIDVLTDNSKVRVQTHGGRERLTVRPGTFGAAELEYARRWSTTIAQWVSDVFEDVDMDGRLGIMRQHG